QIIAYRRRDLGLEVVQLDLKLLQAFARELDDGGFLLARVGASALASDAQAGAEVGFGQALGLHVRQEGLQRFHPGRRLARGVCQILLIALDFELRDLRNRAFGANVPHETVNLARCQFTLACWEPAEVLRRNLTQPLRVNFLYDCTSGRAGSAARRLAK